jgi:cob(I)alamin adenosyltransferase
VGLTRTSQRERIVSEKGLIVVFTGDGKGKTSAALGIALRAYGHRMTVSLVQFVKGTSATGEALAAERLAPDFELLSLGKGFVNCCGSTTPLEEHRQAAADALTASRKRMSSDAWDILILDEINTAVSLGLLDIQDVLTLIRDKPPRLHLVLTGRDAHPDVIAAADMATEMRCLKHPYDAGKPARKGIDF